jgi:hypothetical protein
MMVVPRGLSIFFGRNSMVVRAGRRAIANANGNDGDDDGNDRCKILSRQDDDDDPATQSVVARMTIATTSKNTIEVDNGRVG